jgi:hypothetical protein
MKLNDAELNKNNVAECGQYTNNAQYTIIKEHPTNEAQGELKGTNCMKAKGLPGLSLLRSDGSQGSQVGRLNWVSRGHWQLKGGHQARVHSDQMVS